jgi:molecular chaperone GrpE
VAAAHKYAIENFAEALVPVMDSLQAALAAPQATLETLRSGVELTLRQLNTAFEKGGIVAIDPVGEKFDPHRHQAMTAIDSQEPANTVVQVYQKGYLVHERVLRPALVVVAKPKDA